jgi:threonyl-tRNA synthetase
MERKYLIINKNGEISEAEGLSDNNVFGNEFKYFVSIEAFDSDSKQNYKSDYLYYAKKLGFAWEPYGDIGFCQYDYKAYLIIRLVKEYARLLVNRIGFPIFEIRGANIFDMSYPVVKAYRDLYGERLFHFKSGKKEIVMSYDASYPQFNLASRYKMNYKNLPFAHFSIADCYRHEQKGECMLLYRNRRFFMPDLHPYFKDANEAFKWYEKIEKQIINAARECNIEYQVIAEVSSQANWKLYKDKIKQIAINNKKDILIKILQDKKDRYWIINVDYKIIDQLRQSREIACIQIDVQNAKRLDIKYLDKNNKVHYPVIIHAAVPGGIERFVYMLFDNFKASFPIWLYPIQIRLIPVSEKYLKFCEKLLLNLKNEPIRIDLDDRSESVSKRIKLAKEELIPYYFIIGEKEKNDKKELNDFYRLINVIRNEMKNKPFINFNWPYLVSRQAK